MKIAIDAINLHGGGITHLSGIINNFNYKDNKIKIVIWCNKKVKKSINNNKHIIFKNYKIFEYNLIIRSIWSLFFFSCDVYKNKCDVIFCLNGINLNFLKPCVMFFQNALPLNKKIINKSFPYNKKIKYFIQYILYWYSYKKSKGNIFPSLYCKKLFEKNFGKHKNNNVAYHGVNIPKKVSFSNNSTILCISSLEPFKNIINLIKAAKILSNEKIRYFLQIIGPGTKKQKEEVAKLIKKLKLNNNIKYINEINQKKLRNYLINARILVNPSLCESFGLTNLEGFVCGSNVVCTNLPVFKEILKDYPYYFNGNSSISIANQLKISLKESRFSRKNIQNVKNTFDWTYTSTKTFDIINCAKNKKKNFSYFT